MPVFSLSEKYISWYGELNFETNPIYATANQEDVEISARIRIIQNRTISNQDVAILSGIQYEIKRAFHGIDEENGQPITDLTLVRVVQNYDIN